MSAQLRIHCPRCAAVNRVPADKMAAGLVPVCGRCKTKLNVDEHPLDVTDATFHDVVEQSPVPVLVDLWAPWCGPCRMIAPVISELASQMSGTVRFAKVNVDENGATAARFNVSSIPTMLIMRDGREVDRLVGALPKSEIVRRLEYALEK